MGVRTMRVAANGLMFAVDVCGEGRKHALLLHGFPESRFSWRHQMEVFAALGFTAWAPDLRGYGETDCPVGVAAYAMDRLVGDVAGLIDAAAGMGIDGGVVLVAHDWGGVIGWRFVLARVRKVEAFVVMNLPHPKRFAEGLRTWRQMRRSWYVLFFQLPWLPELLLLRDGARGVGDLFVRMAVDKSRFPEAVVGVYRANALRAGRMTAMLNYYRALLRFPVKWEDGVLYPNLGRLTIGG